MRGISFAYMSHICKKENIPSILAFHKLMSIRAPSFVIEDDKY
jgi:hypothetical protein